MSISRRGKWPPLISIDFLVHELKRLPVLVLGVWLSRIALGGGDHRTSNLDYFLQGLLIFLWTWRLLAYLFDRWAWNARRNFSWDDEVIVITGGSSGLGRVIAQIYGMRGVSVAILDIRPFDESAGSHDHSDNIKWYKTDVGNEADILKAKQSIETDLGTPTILINNAGIVNGKTLLGLETSALERNFRVNLLSHFYSIRAFLPAMLSRSDGGTIVTVSSVLGDLGVNQLADYTAAKAGLTAMHKSLRAELSMGDRRNVQTILVKPGQLSTPLFMGVQTPSSFMGPVVDPLDLAQAIIAKIDSGKSGVVAMPLYADYIEWLNVLPHGLQKIARFLAGVDRAMQSFKGP